MPSLYICSVMFSSCSFTKASSFACFPDSPIPSSEAKGNVWRSLPYPLRFGRNHSPVGRTAILYPLSPSPSKEFGMALSPLPSVSCRPSNRWVPDNWAANFRRLLLPCRSSSYSSSAQFSLRLGLWKSPQSQAVPLLANLKDPTATDSE